MSERDRQEAGAGCCPACEQAARAAHAQGRREALREAAAAMCRWCSEGMPLSVRNAAFHDAGDKLGTWVACGAAPIRALLAQPEGGEGR